MNITEQLINEFDLQPFQITNTLELFDQGATVPFIARYRKERTGSLDEIQVRDLLHRYTYYRELDERRNVILDSIRIQGKLTPELEEKINGILSKTELEDLYLPYKPKRTTRATKAKDAGLEPLARWLVDLEASDANLLVRAGEFLNPEKEIDTPEKALQGACDILAEELSDDAETRKWMRELAVADGLVTSVVKKEFEGQKTKFEMYYDFKEKVSTLPSHRILAMFRGEREKVLRIALVIPEESAIQFLMRRLIKHSSSAAAETLRAVVLDGLNRLLLPATETEIRKEIRERAESEAFKVFGENLEALLLSPPAGRKPVMAIDPGFRTGCKVVVVDDTGKFIENATIYPHEPQNNFDEGRAVILIYTKKYGIKLIAIGNGTASRETDEFVKKVLSELPPEERPVSVIVSEAGASVYSASDVAIKEFPELDLTIRGSISIARRLQDPLSELVKIEPRSIGVGQYQHDVSQAKLKESLDEVVESCVNRVGVDVNLASEELLKYVSGLNRLIASNIVTYRNGNGAFSSRKDLLKVPGMGEKKFQLAAGFLRIQDGANPLDNSSVHPERYEVVNRMAESLKTTIRDLIGNTAMLRTIDKSGFVGDEVGLPTIEDILSELEKPGRDPRQEFQYAKFNDAIKQITDLKEGMILEGTVTNVANFGAFVDIGVHQDGLVHISELSNTFISDPKKVVKVGRVVKVRVVKVDAELKRISLSMKLEPVESAPRKEKPRRHEEPQRQQRGTPRPQQRGHDRRPEYKAPPKVPSKPPEVVLSEKFNNKEKADPRKLKMYKPKFNIRQLLP